MDRVALGVVAGALTAMTACGDNRAVPAAEVDAACVPLSPPAEDCSDRCFDDDGPRTVLTIDPAEINSASPPAGSRAVRIAIFYTVAPQTSSDWTREDAVRAMQRIVTDTNGILDQCLVHVEVEAAQVVALPARLLDLDGNEPGSFGGHPPPGTPNPDLFDYQQNERLTAESRELFRFGKQHSSKNSIGVFTVEHIVYYSNQELAVPGPGGLSNPPNIYHHPDDYPFRNSVLLVPSYGSCGDLPGVPGFRTLAHELGHMLLNSGGHSSEFRNLMNDGTNLTAAQCTRMEEVLATLYGDAEVPDPGPPS